MGKTITALLTFFSGWVYATDFPEVTAEQLIAHTDSHYLILDVRSEEEFAEGHIANAINIPHDAILDRLVALEGHKDKPILLYCRSGYRAGKAADVLKEQGFSQLFLLEGHMLAWRDNQHPIQH